MRYLQLLLPAASLVFVGCTASDGPHIYKKLHCNACHGSQLEGSPRGPALRDLSKTWESDEALADYLLDPDVKKRPGLEELSRSFKLEMMPLKGLSKERALLLAAWLRDPDQPSP